MRDFDENNITAAVIDRYKNTPDPRLKKIMTSLVQHLHDFVRDVELTEAEWTQAIDYLTRTGSCAPTSGRSSFCCRTRWAFRCWWTPSIIALRRAPPRPR